MSPAEAPRAAGAMEETADALLLDPRDDVATALRPLAAGAACRVRSPAGDAMLDVRDDIPMGHKLAVRDVAEGSPIRKHAEVIGAARERIHAGEHVHVHNVASLRAKRR